MAFEDDKFRDDIVARYQHWTVFMHPSQAYLGRCFIALNREDLLDPYRDTTPAEKRELELAINQFTTVLNKLFQPDKFDQAVFGNEWQHCHLHLIPRYRSPRKIYEVEFIDHNWGKNYAPYPKDFTIPTEVYERIKQDIKTELLTF